MPTTLVASQLSGMLSNLFLTRTYSFCPPTLPDTGCGLCVAKKSHGFCSMFGSFLAGTCCTCSLVFRTSVFRVYREESNMYSTITNCLLVQGPEKAHAHRLQYHLRLAYSLALTGPVCSNCCPHPILRREQPWNRLGSAAIFRNGPRMCRLFKNLSVNHVKQNFWSSMSDSFQGTATQLEE